MYLSICKSPVLGTYLSTCKIPVLGMYLSICKSPVLGTYLSTILAVNSVEIIMFLQLCVQFNSCVHYLQLLIDFVFVKFSKLFFIL
jgi:hypothetical protein